MAACWAIKPALAPSCLKPNVKGVPTNWIPCKEVSVQTNICPVDFTAPIILDPSVILNDPASFVAIGVKSVASSLSENLNNKSSWVEESPIVVSVPNISKCLVSVETRLNLEAVGAFDKAVALLDKPLEVSQTNVPPFKTVAIKSSPKLSNDQLRAKRTTVDEDLAVSQVLVFHDRVPQPVPYVDVSLPIFIWYLALPEPPPPDVEPDAVLVCVIV